MSEDAPYTGLPAAPTRDGRLCLPRQVRAGLPKELDVVIGRVLRPRGGDDPIISPRALRLAISSLDVSRVKQSTEVAPATPGEAAQTKGRRLPRWWPIVPALVLLLGVGVGGWLLGLVIGKVPGDPNAAKKVPGLHASPSAGASTAPQALALAKVVSFDPQGDGLEDETDVDNASDGSTDTSWSTEFYDSTTFGGLKRGVGLLVDLGSAKTVSQVVVDAPAGETLEILAAPTATSAPTQQSDTATPVVSGPTMTADGKETILKLATPTSSRYFVLWITGLRQVTGQAHSYGAQINEMAFYA